MKQLSIGVFAAMCLIGLVGCGKKETPSATEAPAAPGAAAAPAAGDTKAPAAGAPSEAPAAAAAKPAEPPPPPPPPPPKTWTIPAGTTIAIRTMDGMSTKNAKTGNEFDATLAEPLVVEGTTLAKAGGFAVGTVASSDQGGKVKGKAMLTVSLARITLSDGRVIPVQTNSVSQEAKSGTKKNVVRTGLMAGGGAAIGAIAGGGKGAAIGAGIGAGAGVATNMATRGPAAEVPAEALLTFRTKSPITVTEKVAAK